MRSDGLRALLDSRLVRSLSGIRLGIVLGFAASALLALSSLTIPDPRGGKGLPFSESFEPFLASFELRYAWFWPLASLLSLFALNVLLSTLRASFFRRREAWDLRFAGVVLMHIGVVAGLVTHLAAGLSAKVEQDALLTRAPTAIAGRAIALVELSPELNRDGSLRTASATVSVDGERRTLAYNEPLFFDGMRRFVLIQELRQIPGGAELIISGERRTVMPGEPFGPKGAEWVYRRLSTHPSLRVPMALVRRADGSEPWRWVAADELGFVQFAGLSREPALVVIVRRNDGIPILLAASAIFGLGLVLFLAGRRRRPEPG